MNPPAPSPARPGGGDRWRSPATPLALLFLALATVFLFGGDRGHFYRDRAHEHITWNHMTVAGNLAPEHHFLGFTSQFLDADGERSYSPYNRFPVLGHVLIRLVTLPFPDDASTRLFAARMLMLVFFAAAATLAYFALCRLVRNRWTALAATLLSFSSYYALHYNDTVATEGVIDLFGLLLVFHGMAVFATEGRFVQLLAKTCVALLLGWHVYALLLPFVLLGLAPALRCRDKRAVRRHLTLGVVALLFGSVVLGANFTREYVAMGGETPLAKLPSVKSMLHRTGLSQNPRDRELDWPAFAGKQSIRIGLAPVPYAVSHFIIDSIRNGKPDSAERVAGVRMYVALGFAGVLSALIVLTTLALILSPATRHRLPLAALALSGPCWAVAMRYQAHIPFEGLFNVGIPLVLFALMLPRLDRLLGGEGARRRVGPSVLAGVTAVPMFALSSLLMALTTDHGPEDAAHERALTADVDSIRGLAQGKTIFVSQAIRFCGKRRRWRSRIPYYFTGSVFAGSADRHLADFVVSERIEDARTLTPDHRLWFLYDRISYDAALSEYEQYAKHDAPVLESPDYDVFLIDRNTGHDLLYFRDHCPAEQVSGRGARLRFFLHVYPVDPNDLPADRRRLGFDDLDFEFAQHWRKDGKCYAVCRLPGYGIARIRTGQSIARRTSKGARYGDVIWGDSFSPDQATGGVLRSSRPPPS